MSAAEPAIVPYLTVRDARAALDFYTAAFGAQTLDLQEDEGGVYHARTSIAGGLIMMYEERAGAYRANRAPDAYGGSSVAIRINLITAEAVDRAAEKACAAGGELVVAPTDRPWGRLAEVRDPQGHVWRLAATAPQS